jgi:hypothetical protein
MASVSPRSYYLPRNGLEFAQSSYYLSGSGVRRAFLFHQKLPHALKHVSSFFTISGLLQRKNIQPGEKSFTWKKPQNCDGLGKLMVVRRVSIQIMSRISPQLWNWRLRLHNVWSIYPSS